MRKPVYRACGLFALGLGGLGVALPLLPTTPFLILAAYCFSRSHREWEARLLDHPQVGPAIRAWRAHRAIPPLAKGFALVCLVISAVLGWFSLPDSLRYLPGLIALPVALWMLSRPSR